MINSMCNLTLFAFLTIVLLHFHKLWKNTCTRLFQHHLLWWLFLIGKLAKYNLIDMHTI